MMSKVITIGRQFGSNGHAIGQKLAEELGIPFYDKEILTQAAKNSGLSEQLLKNLDEKPNKSFLYNLVMDPYSFGYTAPGIQTNLNQQAFQAIYDTVKMIGENGPCVIVGRCADYALRNNKNLIRLFIHAPLETRIKTVAERFALTEDKAKNQIAKEDKARASYYNYYTSQKWGSLDSYDMFFNSSILGVDGTVGAIIACLNQM